MQELSPFTGASKPQCTQRYDAAASSTPGCCRTLPQSHPYDADACPGNPRVPGLPRGSCYPANNTFRSKPHILKVFLAKPGNS